jgi:hypothetical protein
VSPIPEATADRALLERLLRESGVDRSAPSASVLEYLAQLLQAVLAWLGDHARPLAWVVSSDAAKLLLWAMVTSIFVALALFVARLLAGRTRGTPAPLPGREAATHPRAPERDRLEWRREVDARLLRGDVAAALEALWWWLARALSGPGAEASWTSRELLARAGRGDLRPLTNTLDRMAYGAGVRSADEVRRLLERLEASLT